MPSPARFDPIDHVLALDLGGRGIGHFFTPGAALAAARALRRARRVLIVTGFSVPPGIPETDGPPGAAILGRALRRLGAAVRYLTDEAVRPPLAAALAALDEPADIEVWSAGGDGLSTARRGAASRGLAADAPRPPASFDAVSAPVRPRAASILARTRPTHLVAIERPGRTRAGEYLSARGESIADWNAPLDELFLAAAGGARRTSRAARTRRARGSRGAADHAGSVRGPVTVGIGDGGNEIGMGNVRGRLVREGRLMARIASAVRVDHLVVAGASNWGGYGVVAALARLTGEPLLHSPELERRMLEACVKAGAVDGVTRRAEPTVDGLPCETHQAVVELLTRAIPDAEGRRALIRARSAR